jgi:chemotaxis protein CheZ
MVKPVKFDESGDTEDLQALFDSISAGGGVPAPAPVPVPDKSGDSDELQALFDSVVAAQVDSGTLHGSDSAVPTSSSNVGGEGVFNRLGHMARQLHDSLRQLGYDKMLEDTARQIPDARQRLTYIAQMTEQAAARVLNATDIAKPLQDELLAQTDMMAARWERMFANQLSVEEFRTLAADTRTFFLRAPENIRGTNDQLMEIMMAQDFQDLTGQVIRKVVEMVQGLETQLLQVLIDAIPAERKIEVDSGLMNGPAISVEGRTDVVSSQSQVDELLESLGF